MKDKLIKQQEKHRKELINDFARVMRLLRSGSGNELDVITEIFMKHINKAHAVGYNEGKEYMQEVKKQDTLHITDAYAKGFRDGKKAVEKQCECGHPVKEHENNICQHEGRYDGDVKFSKCKCKLLKAMKRQ
jgi:hypothetical protein